MGLPAAMTSWKAYAAAALAGALLAGAAARADAEFAK